MVGNQSKRPHSKTATTRTATLSGITTRTATLLRSKRPHCFGQNGHISWLATKTATLHLVKTATLFLVKTATGRISNERSRFGFQNGLTAFSQNGHTLFVHILRTPYSNYFPLFLKWAEVAIKTATLQFAKNTTIVLNWFVTVLNRLSNEQNWLPKRPHNSAKTPQLYCVKLVN